MRYVYTFVAAVGVAAVSFVAAASAGRADEPAAGRLVSLEVLVVDASGGALGDGEVTAAKVLELASQGKLDAAARIQMSAVENVQTMVTFSETVPVESGRMFGGAAGDRGGGRQMGSYSMQNHGTTIQAMARVEQDGAIILNLQAERSRLVTSKPAGEDAGAANIAATKTTQARVQTTTRLTSGKPAIVGSQAAGTGKDAVHTYFVLTATLPEGGGAAAAAPAAVTKIVTLSHARAVEMAKTLQAILQGQSVRLIAEERTNSVIIHGSPEAIEPAIALMSRLDES